MSRINLENPSILNPKISGARNASITFTLTGSFTIPSDGPKLWIMDGGLSDRTIRLPPMSYGSELVISNIGNTNNFNITDSSGNLLVTVAAQTILLIFAGATRWVWLVENFSSSSSNDDHAYWANKAALLDPRAYVYKGVGVINETVPVSETWWMLNGWIITPDGNVANGLGLHSPHFHRIADIDQAIPLAAGTTITNYVGDGLTVGFIYYCRPKLVYDIDARYTNDPKGLYERRIKDLQTLTPKRAFGVIPRGSPNGTQPTQDFSWSDPGILYGFILQTWMTNASWVLTYGSDATGAFAPINMLNEISDLKAQRECMKTYMPFVRKQPGAFGYTGIKVASGNTAGDYGNTDALGQGGVFWVELSNVGW